MHNGLRTSRVLRFHSRPAFEPHYGEMAILRGLSDGSIIRGQLLVSKYNNSRGNVITDSREKVPCNGFMSRNRALSMDRVYGKLVEEVTGDGSTAAEKGSDDQVSLETILSLLDESTNGPKSCKVVGIERRSGHRYVARSRPDEALVQPRDPRFPAMRLLPPPKVTDASISLVSFKEWDESAQYPDCELIRNLGKEGAFDAEDDSSLEMNGLLSAPFTPEIDEDLKAHFPDSQSVVNRELSTRRDCRSERVFSIDPATAKDLDDAISVLRNENGTLRIGVHVADVSYFVRSGSSVDRAAKERSTSVYLPRKVYPMLPPYLSEDLCSLLPDADRLAFSVYFDLDSEGSVVGEPEIVRTVIRSRVKLSYEDVDAAIAGSTCAVPSDIMDDITLLMQVTEKVRCARIVNGSISIDDRNGQELKFEFLPLKDGSSYPVQILTTDSPTTGGRPFHDSHTLIEELMVLTNKIIANKLMESSHVTLPVVRRHLDTEAPVQEAAREFLSRAGIPTLPTDTLSEILVAAKTGLTPSLFTAFTHSILGEFNRAEYVVPTSGDAQEGLGHWGVGTARYMHFTSPIRRYADLIVHRKIAHILGINTGEDAESDEVVAEQIKRCNVNSRTAQEAETDNKLFYFGTFVKAFGNRGFPVEAIIKGLILPNEEKGIKGSISFFIPVVGEVRSHSLDAMGLHLVDAKAAENGTVESITVRDRDSVERHLSLLQSIRARAFVRNTSSPLPKFHVRMDRVPDPPSK